MQGSLRAASRTLRALHHARGYGSGPTLERANELREAGRIAESARALCAGEVTSELLLTSVRDRIEQTKALGAFESTDLERAFEEAREVDKRLARGEAPRSKLEGVPVALKANFCTADRLPTTAGSKALAGWEAPYEATVVRRLRDAGAIVIGKTAMDEFGMGSHSLTSASGPVVSSIRSAKDEVPAGASDDERLTRSLRSAGGSSGGSAVAVSTSAAFAALGSDTGGSVRLPAAYTGVVGFKPSYGRLSRSGLVAYASSLDCPGFLTRSVEDARILLSATQGKCEFDPTTFAGDPKVDEDVGLIPVREDVRGMRIGIPMEYSIEELSSEAADVWAATAEFLASLGAEVVEVSLPHTREALATYYAICSAEASSNLARYDGIRFGKSAKVEKGATPHSLATDTRELGFGDEVRRRVLVGNYVLSEEAAARYFDQAQRVRTLVARDFQLATNDCDMLLTPAAPGVAPRIVDVEEASEQSVLDSFAADAFTVPASLAGVPALVVPAGFAPASGLPLAVQLIAPRFGERQLLRAGAALEAELDLC